jgi:hypothetical protein
MTGEERLSELAAILALGYIRLLSRNESQNELDDGPESCAPCGSMVNGNRAVPAMEVA